jgi:hypothetical protein
MKQTLSRPPTERSFSNPWLELAYLCRKVCFWLYARKQPAGAARYAERLASVLHELREHDLAIMREEGLALLSELNDDLDQAIARREREIQLIERLHREAASPRYAESTRSYMLQGHEAADLQERRAILHALKKGKAHSGAAHVV